MLVAPSIYKLDKFYGSNVYILADEDGLILIDVGALGNHNNIRNYIENYLGGSEDDIKTIILTHAHADHCGAIYDILSSTEAKVVVHKKEVSKLSNQELLYELATDVIEIDKDFHLKEFGGIRILYTPGHTIGSISIYKEGLFLATGDTIIVDKNGVLSLELREKYFEKNLLRNSIEKLSRLKFDVLLPGHGRPFIEKGSLFVKKFYEDFSKKF